MTVVLLLAGACAAAAGWLAYVELAGRRRSAALARVAAYGQTVVVEEAEEARRSPLTSAMQRLAAIVVRVTPGRDRERTLVQLQGAGFAGTTPESFLAVKGLAAIVGFGLGAILGAGASATAAVLFGLLLAALGFVAPDVVLKRRAQRRRERMLAELPNALDLLAVIVEAGLGFDAALVRYADTAEGPLAEEIRLLAAELRVGDRVEAFRRVGERVDAPEMKAFVRSVVHADQLGTSLSRTLRGQAADVRQRRQTAAEERANKLPVKMLFPTIFCIFPALFLVVLGPPMIGLVHSLK